MLILIRVSARKRDNYEHMGKLIRAELDRQEREVTWLAKQINCERSTCYYIFERRFVNIALLEKKCKVLNRNFCVKLSEYIANAIKQSVENNSTQM